MRILVINPNTTAAMTAALVAEVTRHAPPGTIVDGITAAFGAPVIATRESFARGAEATLDAYPDWRIPAHVINIVPTADRQKATVRVRIAELGSMALERLAMGIEHPQRLSATPQTLRCELVVRSSCGRPQEGLVLVGKKKGSKS